MLSAQEAGLKIYTAGHLRFDNFDGAQGGRDVQILCVISMCVGRERKSHEKATSSR